MSEGSNRPSTGATLADVWPKQQAALTATRVAQPGASVGDDGALTVASAASLTRVSKPRRSASPSRPPATERIMAPRDKRISTVTMEGKLLDHGMARYQFQPTEAPSYYVRMLTSGGVVILWGRGLERAIVKSTTNVRIGDRVAFRRLDQDPQTGRVLWRAEKPEWFAAQDKAASRRRDEQLAALRAAHEDPDLGRAMKAAQALAERGLSDPTQRLKFIASVADRVKQRVQQERPAPTSTAKRNVHVRPEARRNTGREEPDRTR